MISNIEERLSKATSAQKLLDDIHELFSWHGKVIAIQMVVDWDAPRPKATCCIEMANYAEVYTAKIVWGVTPVGDKSFVFNFALDPSLRVPDFSDAILWTNREILHAGIPMDQHNSLPALAF
jgi:hypothetical protein